MRFFRRSLVGLFLLALTLGLAALSVNTLVTAFEAGNAERPKGPPARERVFSANVQLAQAAEAHPQTVAFGEVRARRRLELRSPRAGTVIDLADGFEDGASVTAGQLLLRLDPADATSARDIAQADLERAEAEVRDAIRAEALARDDLAAAQDQAALREQAVQRQRDIAARGVGSEAAIETAALAASVAAQAVVSRRSALAGAQARVDQSRNALTRAGITLAEAARALRDTEVFAEFDGVLSGVDIAKGRIVGANESLGELIDPTALEVSFRLSTAQFTRLIDAEGALVPSPLQAALEVSGTELLAQGRLARVGAAVGAGQSGRQVFATLDTARGFLPGDFVTLRIDEPALAAVIDLPATALGPQGTVLVLGEDDRLEELAVTLLRRVGDRVYLGPEALAGREVVTERSPLLGAGIKVKPLRGGPVAEVPQVPAMVVLTPERRAELVAFVEGNARMPAEAKARILAQLSQDEVPAQVIERLEQRMGG